MAQLLKEMDADDQFPLNELEQEVVDELVGAIEADGSTSVSQ